MTLKVGLMGFGQIGRQIYKQTFTLYDNEWVYSNRVCDIFEHMATLDA